MGVGSKGIIPMGARDLEEALEMGMDWSLREGYAWAEDKVNHIGRGIGSPHIKFYVSILLHAVQPASLFPSSGTL